MSNIHPVRVKTSEGWQELALTGPQGPQGPPGVSLIPGEIKLWGGKVLPTLADYGKWVWADGTAYLVATYPKAASNIATEWRTAHGQADPGASYFRVPDLRGLAPVGLDQMPGGTRANRMTRAIAIVVAGKSGEETHVVTVAEMPAHAHTVNSHSHGGATGTESADHSHTVNAHSHGGGSHTHTYQTWGASQQQVHALTFGDANDGHWYGSSGAIDYSGGIIASEAPGTGGRSAAHSHAISAEAPGTNNQGSGSAHENIQPSVFVPYIVALDS